MNKNKKMYLLLSLSGAFLFTCVLLFILLSCDFFKEDSCTYCGDSLTECEVYHIIENNPEVLEYFAQQGWDTSTSNWENMVTEWCRIAPAEYELALREASEACRESEIPTEPRDVSFELCYLRWLAKTLNGNKINDHTCSIEDTGYLNDYDFERCKCWYKYCELSERWNPLEYETEYGFAMPCTTWVSTIWYLAGVKDMDKEYFYNDGNRVHDTWSWYSYSRLPGKSIPFGSKSWITGEHLYDYTATYHPELLPDSDIPGTLCHVEGLEVKTDGTSDDFIDGTIETVNSELKTGDILQFYGTPAITGGSPWKHTVIVVEDAFILPFYPFTTLKSAQIASFGIPQKYRFPWNQIKYWFDQLKPSNETRSFDFTHVRVIKLPEDSKIPLLDKNLITNPSFEGDEYFIDNWKMERNDIDTEISTYIYTNSSLSQYGDHFLNLYQSGNYKIYQNIDNLQPGLYKIKAFFRSSDGESHCTVNPPSFIVTGDFNTWNYAETSFPITGNSVEISLNIEVSTSQFCYIDDVQLYRIMDF